MVQEAIANMQAVVFLMDMDGVLARWCADGDPSKRGFFLSRVCEPKAKQLVQRLKELGYPVGTCSAVYQNGYAEHEKDTWLNINELSADELFRIFVPYGSDKSRVIKDVKARFGEDVKIVLVDDFSNNLKQWKTAGQLAIKFLNGQNNTKGTWINQGGAAISVEMTVDEMIQHLMDLIDTQDGNA